MTNVDLCFSPRSLAESGSVKLLELPPDLCSLVESSLESSTSLRYCWSQVIFVHVFTCRFRLSIKGQSNEDAVLCTGHKTYAIRSVVLSNTILVTTPRENGGSSLDIRDQVNDILELAPCVPRLYKLDTLLRGRTYDENQSTMDIDSQAPVGGHSFRLAARVKLIYRRKRA